MAQPGMDQPGMASQGPSDGDIMIWYLVYTVGTQVIFLLTVLCHELGHGCMARTLGGEVDHIVLMIVGGLCIRRMPLDLERERILRNDFAVAWAGPLTHFPQAGIWISILCLLYWAIGTLEENVHGTILVFSASGYANISESIWACLNPFGAGLEWKIVVLTKGLWLALPWALVGSAIRINVWLFLFNIIVPTHPSDASKLLVTGLIWLCGLPARVACLILLCISVPLGVAFITLALYRYLAGLDPVTCLLAYLGVIGLIQANCIYQLLRQGQLYLHALFPTARSWRRGHSGVARDIADVDDPQEDNWGPCCACLPRTALRPQLAEVQEPLLETEPSGPTQSPGTVHLRQQEQRIRQNRSDFLHNLERQQADQQRSVRELRQ
eukprot:gnl/MRDRNA2_/MRDRNA2_268673_c0_seq1.p1 gnl/MRDRNA2_/MRDRNA2_268673_c0~~gnl/MRDRNA2_/MRDRNA2_268673_c0_seq1.p1  ORF type:complete len:404 (-),score=33.79 gnl/MRDRNA2_/MRDRNA2_268673_c0_seq1:145-1290(-)